MAFQRFTAPDPAALPDRLAAQRAAVHAAQQAGNDLAELEHATDLGALLTTARLDDDALACLQAQVSRAEAAPGTEVAAWFWNAYATALQYAQRRDDAAPVFARALAAAQAGGWARLEAMVRHHWARCQVEQGALDAAEAQFQAAAALRHALNDPLAASSEQALQALAELRPLLHGSCHCGAVRLTLPHLPDVATRCNCSKCRRIEGVWAYYAEGTVRIDGHPEHTHSYVWGDQTLSTVRCAHCGCVTHWDPISPEAAGRQGINLNNFDPQVIAGVRVRRFDGAQTWTFLD